MNSLGLSKRVNWLYLDTNDGLIYFEIFDIIKSGIVDWSRVTKYILFELVVIVIYSKLFFCILLEEANSVLWLLGLNYKNWRIATM